MHGLCNTNRQLPQALASGAGPESLLKSTRPTALALRHPLLRQFNGQRSTMKNAGIAAQRACTLAVAETDLEPPARAH